MSHIFGKGSIPSFIGDVLGGGAGFLIGGPAGAAIGAGLGGAAGSAIGGGKPIQDLEAGLAGATLGYGAGSLAAGAGFGGAGAAASGATDAAAGGASAAAGLGSTVASAAPGVAAGSQTAADAAAAGLAGAADPTVAALSTTPLAVGGPSAGVFAGPAGSVLDPVTGQAVSASTSTDLIGGGFGKAAPSVLDKIGTALGGTTAKTVGEAVSGLGLAKNLMTANKPNPIPGMSNIQQIAQTSATQGQTLQQYLTTGTLPPAIQASVDRATQDGITALRSKYASMGVAPNSSAEISEINSLKQEAVVKGASLADQLYQQGTSQTTLAADLYKELVGANTKLTDQTNSAIGNLASALAGGGRTVVQSGTAAA